MKILSGKTKSEVEKIKFEEKLNEIREIRNQKIKETDYVLLCDTPYSDEFKEQIKIYRKELRDLPNKILSGEIDIDNVIFPEEPSSK